MTTEYLIALRSRVHGPQMVLSKPFGIYSCVIYCPFASYLGPFCVGFAPLYSVVNIILRDNQQRAFISSLLINIDVVHRVAIWQGRLRK